MARMPNLDSFSYAKLVELRSEIDALLEEKI